MKKNQRELVMDYINEFGSITRFEAFVELGITELPKRVSELRQGGVNIVGKTETGKNRRGVPTHWTRYSMGCSDG